MAVRVGGVIVACVAVSEQTDAVPDGVLAAFGVAGVVPVRLPGGQGTTWRAGQVVLKPADSVAGADRGQPGTARRAVRRPRAAVAGR